MVNQYRLYTIREWEQAQPEGVSFSWFFLTSHSGEVRKVTGTIRVSRRKLVNGVMCRIPTGRRAFWDGYGRCYAGTHNIRKRDYDIPLRTKGGAGLSEKNATL
ncbi:hypothetical protein [Phocaeicola sartorii]|jgi:hypothetical protein|uniref:hypothetical protein n=1 Tax=Phocaeicola sartorii TaxID=671267 RepID=UPI0020599B45|nr:hypothetical protein [Phocaeicola sartorii]DAM50749.1 MAG TPA: hypothetical protein [Caudoviricetes sp.]